MRQSEVKGGNAVNLAHALARLGDPTFLVTHTDSSHESLLREAFSGLKAEFSIKRLPPGLTVAIEGSRAGRNLNVMLGELGGAADFPPSLLTEEDWNSIRDSEVVCVVNWAANKKGNQLVRAVKENVGSRNRIFLDPADVRDRLERYSQLLSLIKRRSVVDWMSLNEPEARATGKILGVPGRPSARFCAGVANELGITVDLHTERGSYTSDGRETFAHESRPLSAVRLTGAGDVWDAASVHFFLKRESARSRIALADAAAGLYLRSRDGRAPTESEVLASIRR